LPWKWFGAHRADDRGGDLSGAQPGVSSRQTTTSVMFIRDVRATQPSRHSRSTASSLALNCRVALSAALRSLAASLALHSHALWTRRSTLPPTPARPRRASGDRPGRARLHRP
jgi:hypothetical protein